jgi:hypothetical protein
MGDGQLGGSIQRQINRLSCSGTQVQADLAAVMRWERQLMISFLFQLDPEGSPHHLQRREAPGGSSAHSGPQVLVSHSGNEVWA